MYTSTSASASTSTSSQSNVSLSASVSSLRSSLSLLDSSIAILDAGIADFPRLKRVLGATRHFELTPQPTLHAAQASLASELRPAITTLVARSEAYIAKLERKQLGLVARSELLEGRLGERKGGSSVRGKEVRSGENIVSGNRKEKIGKDGKDGREEERKARLRMLRQKKERLGYAVERLTLQSQQRQRQLRMSVAAPVNFER